MNLGENIYRLRSSRKLSQDALAEALEVSRQSVSKWENNMAVPDLDKLIKMRDLFGITLDELVAEEPPEPVDEPASQPREDRPSFFQRQRRFLLVWGVYLAAAYFVYRVLIQYKMAIPLAAVQAGISIYSLHDIRNTSYPFTKWGKLFLGLCACFAYFFGLRLFTLESGGWPVAWLTGDFYEQMYLVMLIFHIAVTVLIKALISWLKTRRKSP